MLIVGVGVVLFGFSVVKRPAFWQWMFPEEKPIVQAESTTDVASSPNNHLHPDEFVLSDTGNKGIITSEHSARRISYDGNRTSETSRPEIPRVPDELLKTIKDDVIGIHSGEAEAYFAAMKLAAKVEQRRELNARRGSYALFMDSPNGSRGIAWQISGRLRRLSEVSGRTNAFGVGTLYDAWISTPDSGNELVHVVAMSTDKALSNSLKRSKNRTVDFPVKNPPDVRCTAYFFKREGYASSTNAGISLAPLLVAGTLHDIPPKVVTSTRADQLTPYIGWLTVAVCVGIVFMVWSFVMSDQQHTQTRTHQLTKLPVRASFEDVSAITVTEALGQMQNQQPVDSSNV